MFGDFFRQFGLNDLLQQFAAANAPQPPFGPGQVDAQGGVFGAPGAPGGDQSGHMAGLGGHPGATQSGGAGLGAPPGTSGQEMAKPAPTAASVAAGPTVASGSPLSPGGGSPIGPGQTGLGEPGQGLDKRADELLRSPDIRSNPRPRGFEW